ncbi:hypothetical protein BDC45DRAFT_569381 [Circinella umbellata]|nr:hypothetical protein BDC45DRAFT_569381 [Circinella umbellata]
MTSTLSRSKKARKTLAEQDINALSTSVVRNKEERDIKTIDFIVRLPVEIVYSIFQYLPRMHIQRYINVSEAWRSKIINFSPYWSTIRIHSPNSVEFCLMPYITSHIRNLYVTLPPLLIEKVIKLLSEKPLLI